MRHQNFAVYLPRPATQTTIKVDSTPNTSNLPHTQRATVEDSQVTSQHSTQATILSRSCLADGDVRFVLSVQSGPTGTEQTVSLERLLDFVSLQQLHDFENEHFAQAHQAEYEKANTRRNRRRKPGRSGESVSRFLEGGAGFHGGVVDAISSLQGPLVRPGSVGKFRGSRHSSNEIDPGDARTSNTTSTATPSIEGDMRNMGVPEGHNSTNITDLPYLHHQQDSLDERRAKTETLNQSGDELNSSDDESVHSETVQAPSVSRLSHSRKMGDKDARDDAAALLRQFQGSQVLRLGQRPESLIEGKESE